MLDDPIQKAMKDSRLHYWLRDNAPTIMKFMDYNPEPRPGSLVDSIDQWLNNPKWNDDGRSVASLGFDGTGGEFVHWGRPGADAAVVYFGSEGGLGVLAANMGDWVWTVARGPAIVARDREATLYVPETRPRAAAEAQRAFHRSTARAFGPDPGPGDVTDLNAELQAWATARLQTFAMRDMRRMGLQGGPGSGALRARVCAELGLRKANAKALVKRLNADGIDRPTFERALEAARADVRP